MPPELKSQLPETKPAWQEAVEASQSDYYAEHGKYQSFIRDTIEKDSEVHEYVGPLGAGYVVFEHKQVDTETYTRITNVGPETWRSADWFLEEKRT